MNATLIVNARLVNEDREFDGDLRINDGRIDVRATNHVTHTLEEEVRPYASAPSSLSLTQFAR